MTQVDKIREDSKTNVLFRVIARVNVTLIEFSDYPSAAAYCQNYDGPDELEIRKVWVPKRKG